MKLLLILFLCCYCLGGENNDDKNIVLQREIARGVRYKNKLKIAEAKLRKKRILDREEWEYMRTVEEGKFEEMKIKEQLEWENRR